MTEKFYVARIVAGVVAEVLVVPFVGWPESVGMTGTWVNVTDAPERPGEGWTYDGETFQRPA